MKDLFDGSERFRDLSEGSEYSRNITKDGEESVTAPADSPLTRALRDLAAEGGPQALLDGETLRRELLCRNVPAAEADRLSLMTGVTGYRALLEKDGRTQQADLDRYVANAVRETELNRAAVLRLTREIAQAAGLAFDYAPEESQQEGAVREQAFTVPASLYQQELELFDRAFRRKDDVKIKLPFHRLIPLVNAGIPRAKYYYGYCLLHGLQQPQDGKLACRLLEEAAAAGDPRAAAELGNYWFEQGPRYWGRAYGYYTGFGALALDPKQRDAVREILNQQRFNRKLLALSVLLFLLLFSTLVFVPGARLWAARRAAGVPCAVLAAGLLVYTGLRCRTRPYEPIYFAPAGVFGFWAVYTLIRLL